MRNCFVAEQSRHGASSVHHDRSTWWLQLFRNLAVLAAVPGGAAVTVPGWRHRRYHRHYRCRDRLGDHQDP